jgi:hypothetical protein
MAHAQQPHTLTGDVRVHKSFHSKILNNDRDVLATTANYDRKSNVIQSSI